MKGIFASLLIIASLISALALTSFYLSDPVKVQLKHSSTILPGQTTTVEVTVDKGIIEGFGLLEIALPKDTKAEAAELNGASFNIENGKIRIVWMRMPNDPVLRVTFNLTRINSDAEPLKLVLAGNFSHIENNYRKDVAFESNGSDSMENNEPALAAADKTLSDQNTPQVEENIPDKSISKQTASTSVSSEDSNSGNKNNLKFRVQILASHKVVDKSFLLRFYGFENAFNIEHHNGWEKYVTGEFENLEDARQYRLKIAETHPLLPGPFVTAYNGNERISVTEALKLLMTASL